MSEALDREEQAYWEVGDPPLIRWRDVTRLFKDKTLCRLLPGWHEVLQSCAIFDMSEYDLAPNTGVLDDVDLDTTVRAPLPFPSVAMLMGWAVIVVREYWFHEKRQVFGADLLCVGIPFTEWAREVQLAVDARVEVDFSHPTRLALSVTESAATDVFMGHPVVFDTPTSDPRPFRPSEQGRPMDTEAVKTYFYEAIRALAVINAPTRFIVREAPARMGKTKRGEIPRLHSRPKYIVLDKRAIATRYLDSQPAGRRSPLPHLRRGHYRTLAANRYKEPGKRVWVRATHVKGNTVEWREGDRMYKVI